MWDFELWPELNNFADLNYAIRGHIIQETLKMEHENRWERLDEHFLARLAIARRTELRELQVRDACECVFYNLYRIVLLERFDVSHKKTCVGRTGGEKTDLDVEME
jgi:hypothetical protein